jgi:hypothetical protein
MQQKGQDKQASLTVANVLALKYIQVNVMRQMNYNKYSYLYVPGWRLMNPGGVGGAVRPLSSLQAPLPPYMYLILTGLWLDKAILLSKPYRELQGPNMNLPKQRWPGPEPLENLPNAGPGRGVFFFSQCHFKDATRFFFSQCHFKGAMKKEGGLVCRWFRFAQLAKGKKFGP